MSIFSFSRPPINLLNGFDTELQDFYSKVILKTFETNLKMEKEVKQLFAKIRKQQGSGIKSNPFEMLNFNSRIQTAAYIFKYSPCYTSAVANHFLKMVNDNPLIFRDALWKRYLNICCLCNGPVFEVVALSKLLLFAQDCFWLATRRPLYLQVTVVGNSNHWKKVDIEILQTLKETLCMFDESKMLISFHYLKADLTKPMTTRLKKILKVADIVMMVKFISFIKLHGLALTGISRLIEDIANNMKNNATLFYLDTSLQQWRMFQNSIGVLNDFKCIYGPVRCEAFTLTLNSIRRCVELFWEKFQSNLCLTSCNFNSCAWYKAKNIKIGGEEKVLDPFIVVKSFPSKVRRQKRAEIREQEQKQRLLSERILHDFHQKVHQILPKKIKISEIEEDEEEETFLEDFEYSKIRDITALFNTKSKDRRIFLYLSEKYHLA